MQRKLTFLFIILISILSCNSKNQLEEKSILELQKDSLKLVLENLPFYKPQLQKIDRDFTSNRPYENSISRENFEWFYDKLVDTVFFTNSYELKPLGRLFENDSIVSIAFTDIHDYSYGIDVINFKKKGLYPASSFTLYLIGGDAEDFFAEHTEEIHGLIFKIKKENGYFNDIEQRDTTYFNKVEILEIEIDSLSGKLNKKLIEVNRDFYIVN